LASRIGIEGEAGIGRDAARSLDCEESREQARADEGYFKGRMFESVERAGASADSLARLVHYELAGRYSVAALAARGRPSLDPCRRQSA
jgi:hypothetical protein